MFLNACVGGLPNLIQKVTEKEAVLACLHKTAGRLGQLRLHDRFPAIYIRVKTEISVVVKREISVV